MTDPTPRPPKASDRIAVIGRTGLGKTVLARKLLEAMPPPRLLIDPKAQETTAYAVTFSDPNKLPDAPVARFVPRDPDDLTIYDRLYGRVFAAGPRVVLLDEAPVAAPANGAPANLKRVLRQGRSRHIGHIATMQRPVEVNRSLLTEAEHIFLFPLHHPADLSTVAGVMAMNPAELRATLDRCAPFGFCWYSARDSVLAVVPPLKRWR